MPASRLRCNTEGLRLTRKLPLKIILRADYCSRKALPSMKGIGGSTSTLAAWVGVMLGLSDTICNIWCCIQIASSNDGMVLSPGSGSCLDISRVRYQEKGMIDSFSHLST